MKNSVMKGAAAVAVVSAGGVLRKVLSTRAPSSWRPPVARRDKQPRWKVVTVNCLPAAVTPDGRLPEPLALFGEAIEVQIRPAPGDRGSELAARLRTGSTRELRAAMEALGEDDPERALRAALRQGKQLLETGEVLQANTNRTARDTVLNRPLAAASRHAGGEGRL